MKQKLKEKNNSVNKTFICDYPSQKHLRKTFYLNIQKLYSCRTGQLNHKMQQVIK